MEGNHTVCGETMSPRKTHTNKKTNDDMPNELSWFHKNIVSGKGSVTSEKHSHFSFWTSKIKRSPKLLLFHMEEGIHVTKSYCKWIYYNTINQPNTSKMYSTFLFRYDKWSTYSSQSVMAVLQNTINFSLCSLLSVRNRQTQTRIEIG